MKRHSSSWKDIHPHEKTFILMKRHSSSWEDKYPICNSSAHRFSIEHNWLIIKKRSKTLTRININFKYIKNIWFSWNVTEFLVRLATAFVTVFGFNLFRFLPWGKGWLAQFWMGMSSSQHFVHIAGFSSYLSPELLRFLCACSSSLYISSTLSTRLWSASECFPVNSCQILCFITKTA